MAKIQSNAHRAVRLLKSVKPIDPTAKAKEVKPQLPRAAKEGVTQTNWAEKSIEELLGLGSLPALADASEIVRDVVWGVWKYAQKTMPIDFFRGLEPILDLLETYKLPHKRHFHAKPVEGGWHIWVNNVFLGFSDNWMVSYYLLVVKPSLVQARRANEK